MKKIIILSLFLVSATTFGAPMSEGVTICYKFSNNKLLNRSSCIVSSGYGAGGTYTSIEQGKKQYSIETQMCYNKKTDEQEECGTSLNQLDASFYFRDLFYKKITDTSLVSEESLKCYITKNKKIDICYK